MVMLVNNSPNKSVFSVTLGMTWTSKKKTFKIRLDAKVVMDRNKLFCLFFFKL